MTRNCRRCLITSYDPAINLALMSLCNKWHNGSPNTGEVALRIAQTMLEQGIDRDIVLMVTGLSEEELAASYA